MSSRLKYLEYKKGSFGSIDPASNDIVFCAYRTWVWDKEPKLGELDNSEKLRSYFREYVLEQKTNPVDEKSVCFCVGDDCSQDNSNLHPVLVHPYIKDVIVNLESKIGNAILFYIPSEEAFGDTEIEIEKANKEEKVKIPPNSDLLIEIKISKIKKGEKKDMNFKRIVFGTFPFAEVFSQTGEEEKIKILKEFFASGGEYFHSSLAYGKGTTEKELGELLKKAGLSRDDYKIISCCGWHANEDGGCVRSGKKEDVLKCFETSCKNFDTDYIDIFMSHLPDPDTDYRETIDAMAQLKRDGKVGKICVSNVTLEQLKEYNYNNDVDYIQQRYSYLNRSLSPEIVEYCKEHNIKIMAYQVLERGLLTDKVLDQDIKLREGDLRNKKPEFQDVPRKEISRFVCEKVAPIAKDNGCSVQELIIAWTLKQIDLPLIGISKAKYIQQYVKASKLELSQEDFELLEKNFADFEEYIKVRHHQTVRELLSPDF